MDPDTGVPEMDMDTGPPPCVYPSGPYGMTGMDGTWSSQIVPESFQWQGYVVGDDTAQTITADDLYDCDGRKGINAILFLMSAFWCGPCQQEAGHLPTWVQTWKPLGVTVVELVVQDSTHAKASVSDALDWRNTFNLSTAVDVVADPNFSFGHSGTNGLPTNVLVDPRTMKVVKVVEGYTGLPDPAVAALAKKNMQ
jgi:thiol-disulfide isomerase/thioredoxin